MAVILFSRVHDRKAEALTRAYLKIIDSVNRMEIGELYGEKGEPPR